MNAYLVVAAALMIAGYGLLSLAATVFYDHPRRANFVENVGLGLLLAASSIALGYFVGASV